MEAAFSSTLQGSGYWSLLVQPHVNIPASLRPVQFSSIRYGGVGFLLTCCPCPLVVAAFSAILRRNPRICSGSSGAHGLVYLWSWWTWCCRLCIIYYLCALSCTICPFSFTSLPVDLPYSLKSPLAPPIVRIILSDFSVHVENSKHYKTVFFVFVFWLPKHQWPSAAS